MPAWPGSIGADFEAYAPGTAAVTLRSIDPDTGATLATAAAVTALKRRRKRLQPGVLAIDQCRFVARTSALGFTPKTRDEVDDADGVTWHVGDAELIGFGELVALDVTRKR